MSEKINVGVVLLFAINTPHAEEHLKRNTLILSTMFYIEHYIDQPKNHERHKHAVV